MGLFEYRDFGLSGEDPDICIDLMEGFLTLPSVRGTDWVVPRLDYRVAGNRRKDRLIFPAEGFIRGAGATAAARREDWLGNVTAVLAVMDPSLGMGTILLSAGYLGLPAGSEATIQARVVNGSPGKVRSYGLAISQLWSFEFEAFMDWDVGAS